MARKIPLYSTAGIRAAFWSHAEACQQSYDDGKTEHALVHIENFESILAHAVQKGVLTDEQAESRYGKDLRRVRRLLAQPVISALTTKGYDVRGARDAIRDAAVQERGRT